MTKLTPAQRAELLASGESKRRAAEQAILEALSKLTGDELNAMMGFKFEYTLTVDEFRAMFEDVSPSQSSDSPVASHRPE